MLYTLHQKKGFFDYIYEELHKNILRLYPTKAGYDKVLRELMKAGKVNEVWRTLKLMVEREVKPSRDTLKELLVYYQENDIDTALKILNVFHGLEIKTVAGTLADLVIKLAESGRWNDILEVEKIARKNHPENSFTKLVTAFFIKAHLEAQNEDEAIRIAKNNMKVLTEEHPILEKDLQELLSKLMEKTVQKYATA